MLRSRYLTIAVGGLVPSAFAALKPIASALNVAAAMKPCRRRDWVMVFMVVSWCLMKPGLRLDRGLRAIRLVTRSFGFVASPMQTRSIGKAGHQYYSPLSNN